MNKMVNNQSQDKKTSRLPLIKQAVILEKKSREAASRFKQELENKKMEGIKHE